MLPMAITTPHLYLTQVLTATDCRVQCDTLGPAIGEIYKEHRSKIDAAENDKHAFASRCNAVYGEVEHIDTLLSGLRRLAVGNE